VSFLPKIKEGAYKQMPYEKINKDTYEKMISKLSTLDFSTMTSAETAEIEKYCTNDTCSL
jgi:hypothetical protein